MDSVRWISWALTASLLAVGCDDEGAAQTDGAEETDAVGTDAGETSGMPTTTTDPTQGTTPGSAEGGTMPPGTDGEDDTTGDDPSDDDTTAADETTGTDAEPATDPRVPGPEGVDVETFGFVAGDGTSLPLTLYIPQGEGPYPVVVFHHGFQLGPADYASYGQHLASWGYIVVMPQMPGSILSPTTHVTLRGYVQDIVDWAQGGGNIEGGPLDGRADPETLALAGHSLGGKISFLTASADARVDAVFGIDPVDTAGGPGAQPSPDNPSVAPELMPLVVAPIGIVGETVNATGGFGGACAPEAENFAQYFNASVTPAVAIEFLTANHMSFLDNVNCGLACTACPAGTDDPATTRTMTHGYLVAFFEMQLRGRDDYRPYLAGAQTQADVDAGLVSIETANGF
ncbi:MAG: hypothetical protein AAGA54_25220 [Myxococcota bacterium]